MEGEIGAIVIDSGSSLMKVGFAGDEYPRSTFPCMNRFLFPNLTISALVGRPRRIIRKTDTGLVDHPIPVYMGDDRCPRPCSLNLSSPIVGGISRPHSFSHFYVNCYLFQAYFLSPFLLG